MKTVKARNIDSLVLRKRKLLREIEELELKKETIVLHKKLTREEKSKIGAGAAIVARLKKRQRELASLVEELEFRREGLIREVTYLQDQKRSLDEFNIQQAKSV